MVRPSREIIYPVISTDINAKHSIAHSHAWDTGHIYTVLNCKFTLILLVLVLDRLAAHRDSGSHIWHRIDTAWRGLSVMRLVHSNYDCHGMLGSACVHCFHNLCRGFSGLS